MITARAFKNYLKALAGNFGFYMNMACSGHPAAPDQILAEYIIPDLGFGLRVKMYKVAAESKQF